MEVGVPDRVEGRRVEAKDDVVVVDGRLDGVESKQCGRGEVGVCVGVGEEGGERDVCGGDDQDVLLPPWFVVGEDGELLGWGGREFDAEWTGGRGGRGERSHKTTPHGEWGGEWGERCGEE